MPKEKVPFEADGFSPDRNVLDLKTDEIPLKESLRMVCDNENFSFPTIIISPTVRSHSKLNFTGKNYEEVLQILASKGKVAFMPIDDEKYIPKLIVMDPKWSETIKSLVKKNREALKNERETQIREEPISTSSGLNPGALLAQVQQKDEGPQIPLESSDDEVTILGGEGRFSKIDALCIVSAVLGKEIKKVGEQIVLSPGIPELAGEKSDKEPLEKPPFTCAVRAIAGNGYGKKALINFMGELMEVAEKSSLGGTWRVQKILPDAIILLDERFNTTERCPVP